MHTNSRADITARFAPTLAGLWSSSIRAPRVAGRLGESGTCMESVLAVEVEDLSVSRNLRSMVAVYADRAWAAVGWLPGDEWVRDKVPIMSKDH